MRAASPRVWLGAALFSLWTLIAFAPAHARPSESGLFAEAGLGATGFVGHVAAHARVGPAASVRLGYDLFPWLSLGIAASAATHEATVPPPPARQHFQVYGAAAELRLAPRAGRFAPFAHGGAGAALMSTNILQRVGILEPEQRESLLFTTGGGLEYQLQDRHYAFGVGADWTYYPQYEGAQTVSGRAYIRYTY
jgi:hypothetical protein